MIYNIDISCHLRNTNSKSPKPSNSSQSIPPSEFLSLDLTRDRKIILEKLSFALSWEEEKVNTILFWHSEGKPWEGVDIRCEKLRDGVGHLRRFPKRCQAFDQVLQAYVVAAGVCCQELEQAKNCRLHIFKGDSDII